jgi:hypothetical protein
MKNKSIVAAWSIAALVLAAAPLTGSATELTDKVKVEIDSVGLHPGMEPGMYVCAAGHLHIKGTVQNLADVPLGKIKVSGKAFDAGGNLVGIANSSTKLPLLKPGDKAEINLEFLTVTGELIKQAKRHEVIVSEASPKL